MTPQARDGETVFRLLTRLFVWRLLDNDLVSPHADRREPLAVLGGAIVSIGVFLTFFLSVDYLAAFVLLPGVGALSALSDRFLFIAGSMAIGALGALMVWDAVVLDARDAAILGALPIAAGVITRAKLAAALIFGIALALALNAAPSVLYPALLTINVRGISGSALLALMAAHATTVTMAGLAGFLSVLAVRGFLRLLAGEAVFARLSSTLQSILVVALVTALLLAPTVRAKDVRQWLSPGAGHPRPVAPVLWYLGLNETLGGQVLAETALVMPPRFVVAPPQVAEDGAARATYRALAPQLEALARVALLAFPIAAAAAVATLLWANRRLPDRGTRLPRSSALGSRLRQILHRRTGHDPEAEAGFFFALQTLTRSAPHRTIVAVALAVGLTHASIVLTRGDPGPSHLALPPAAFTIAIGLILALLLGVAHAVTVPAAAKANWTFRMAWQGDERRYLAGVKAAALLAAAALVVLLLPVHLVLLGVTAACVHSTFALLFAAATVEALFLTRPALPFACSYLPIEHPRIVAPAVLAFSLLITYGFANAERWALQDAARTIGFGVAVCGVTWLLARLDGQRRRTRRGIPLDARPPAATQRLGLSDHIMGNDDPPM